MPSRTKRTFVVTLLLTMVGFLPAMATDIEVLKPRVPPDQIEAARNMTNPLPTTDANIEKGKAIYFGKGFCVSCHGQDGTGLGHIKGLRGKLPRDFTDQKWQQVRMDGELFWILNNGSPGTDMAPFVPLVLTKEEAWQVILYVRSLGKS